MVHRVNITMKNIEDKRYPNHHAPMWITMRESNWQIFLADVFASYSRACETWAGPYGTWTREDGLHIRFISKKFNAQLYLGFGKYKSSNSIDLEVLILPNTNTSMWHITPIYLYYYFIPYLDFGKREYLRWRMLVEENVSGGEACLRRWRRFEDKVWCVPHLIMISFRQDSQITEYKYQNYKFHDLGRYK